LPSLVERASARSTTKEICQAAALGQPTDRRSESWPF
jgi:hypothetical protein